MTAPHTMARFPQAAAAAIAQYWATRAGQQQRQITGGRADQGLRSAVTGGAQMDGIIRLFRDIVVEAGIPPECVFFKKALELPGFFRPTKEWDLLVVKEGQLLLALEAKSQVGPSFGNNFNNRTEEAMGSALTSGPRSAKEHSRVDRNHSWPTSSCSRHVPPQPSLLG
jgi:hypothetical protein